MQYTAAPPCQNYTLVIMKKKFISLLFVLRDILRALLTVCLAVFEKYPLAIIGLFLGVSISYYGYLSSTSKTIKQEYDCIFILHGDDEPTEELSNKYSECIKTIDPFKSNVDFIRENVIKK